MEGGAGGCRDDGDTWSREEFLLFFVLKSLFACLC